MICIEDIGFLLFRMHMSPFIAPDDLLAVRLSSKQLDLVVRPRQFDVNTLVDQHPLSWWSWIHSEIKKVHRFGIDRLLGYMAARHMARETLYTFVTSPLFSQWITGQDREVTSRMCHGAAISGDDQVLGISRAVAYNDWRAAACTAAKFDRLVVVRWLAEVNELVRGSCDDCAMVDAKRLGLSVGAYSGAEFLDWAAGDADDEEVNKPAVVMGLVMLGRHQQLARLLDQFSEELGFLETVACQTAVLYSELETVEMLLERGVVMDETMTRMIGGRPIGYTGMLMIEIRKVPAVSELVMEWYRFHDYVHADFSPVPPRDVLLNPFVLIWETDYQ